MNNRYIDRCLMSVPYIIPSFISSKIKSPKLLIPKSQFPSYILFKTLHLFSGPMLFPLVSEAATLTDPHDTWFDAG